MSIRTYCGEKLAKEWQGKNDFCVGLPYTASLVSWPYGRTQLGVDTEE